jgi:hypothetical protein
VRVEMADEQPAGDYGRCCDQDRTLILDDTDRSTSLTWHMLCSSALCLVLGLLRYRAYALQFCSACAWSSAFCGAADDNVHGRTVSHTNPLEEGPCCLAVQDQEVVPGVYSLMLVARARSWLVACLSLDV